MNFHNKNLQDSQLEDYWERKHTDENYRHFSFSPIFEKYFSLLLKESNGYVLDHGCGGGRISLAITKNGTKVALCDISPTAIKKAISLIQNNDLQDLIVWSHIGQIHTWNGQVDWGGVCSHRVLHAIPMKSRMSTIKKLTNGLRESGKLLVTAKSINCKRFSLLKNDPEFQSVESDGQTYLRKDPFRYVHYFTELELTKILENNDLQILHHTEFDERTGNLLRSEETILNRYWLFYCEKKQG